MKMVEISSKYVLNPMTMMMISSPALADRPILRRSITRPRLISCRRSEATTAFAAKNGGGISLPSVFKKCGSCGGKGAIECPGCKGTGKNKKNGNIFERWKCFNCQGFGLKSCPECGKGGLTPEQRGER